MNFRLIFNYLKETYSEWNKDNAWQKSAALAYYSVFSLPGLLIIMVSLASLIWSAEFVQDEIAKQISSTMGNKTADTVTEIIANSRQKTNNILALIIGIGTLIFGATGVFFQLYKALNDVWEVETSPDASIWRMVISRVMALGLVIALTFLLITSLLISTALSALSSWIESQLPGFSSTLLFIINTIINMGVISLLFAVIFKYMPDARIRWKVVWIGATITGVLFVLGKDALGYYFGQAEPEATFGAAGSIILIMLWVYYTSLIVLFGAEFTQVYATRNNYHIEPSAHARFKAEYRLRELQEKEKKLLEKKDQTERKVKQWWEKIKGVFGAEQDKKKKSK